MILELWFSDKINKRKKELQDFMQQMINRLIMGSYRYGEPKVEQNYMTQLTEELKAYKRTGNREQLINIANYCWLESIAPENKRFHWDATVKSVTRK